MKITIEIDLNEDDISKKIFNSIKQDLNLDREKINLTGKKLIYEFESKNFSHLLAASTSLLKLINEVIELENALKTRHQK